MIGYSPKAARALGFLKAPLNDIEVFVEDTGNRNMWVQILKRLLPHNVRLSSVSLLGGRDKVLAACKLDQNNDGRRKLYIIDGDFDGPRKKRKPRLKFLYRLRCYCIENLLVSEGALYDIGAESQPMMCDSVIRSTINFAAHKALIDSEMKKLFALYAAIMHAAPSVPTVSFSAHRLLDRGGGGAISYDVSKIRQRYRDVRRQALRICSRSVLSSALRAISQNIEAKSGMTIVSGKDYVLPLFDQVLRHQLGYRGTSEQLKIRLANAFDPNAELAFTRAVRAI